MADRIYILKSPGERVPAAKAPVPAPVPVPVPAPGKAAVPSTMAAFSGGLPTPAGIGPVGTAEWQSAPLQSATQPPADDIHPVAATGHRYPATADQPLGAKERQCLAILASQAWKAARAADPDLLTVYKDSGHTASAAADAWRHQQIRYATRQHPAGQIDGLTHATRAHYKDIECHFAMLAGQTPRDFHAAMETGADALGSLRADSAQAGFALKKLRETVATCGLHPNYSAAIIADKCKGATVLNAKQLWQMVYTLKNRANAKLGKGTTAGRNKSQRKGPP